MAYVGIATEEQLMPMLKSGDENAFAILYDSYAALLLGVIVRIVDDRKDAENLLQDCFVKVWQKVDSFNSEKGKLATWLINIARHTAIDFKRSKYFFEKRKNQTLENIGDEQLGNTAGQIPVDSLGLRQLVESLTPDCRAIIEWMYFEGYTQQEITEHFDIPLGTVKSRTRKGLKELRLFYELI
ncbi:MAG: sigma-70 family RNA polymerase sigma factor [Saprospiraceae bacterium]|nr:sigma-70 family RNA polymerase sigma factor [Saprospiraceae bacterium]